MKRALHESRIDNPFCFSGQVAAEGYEWLESTDGTPCLVPQPVKSARTAPGKHYPPPSTLFLDFSRLAATPDAILSFANENGHIIDLSAHAMSNGEVAMGTSLDLWVLQIELMRAIVGLWELVERREVRSLSKVIKRTDKAISYEIPLPHEIFKKWQVGTESPMGGRLARAGEPAFKQFRGKNYALLGAKYALLREVNRHIASNPPIPRLVRTTDGDNRVQFEAPNLLSLMWIEFAKAIAGKESKFKHCACGCGEYFQVGPGAKRTDTRTFSAACRQRLSRQNPDRRPKTSKGSASASRSRSPSENVRRSNARVKTERRRL